MMYRLPDGTTTRSSKKYVVAWRALAAPLASALGWRLFGFDPGLIFVDENGREVDVDTRIAQAFGRMGDDFMRDTWPVIARDILFHVTRSIDQYLYLLDRKGNKVGDLKKEI